MITYNKETKIFKLDTKTTSYVIGIADGKYLGHVYYGKKLHSTDLFYLLRTEEYPFVPSKLQREKLSFLDSFPMEYPFGGTGELYRHPRRTRAAWVRAGIRRTQHI